MPVEAQNNTPETGKTTVTHTIIYDTTELFNGYGAAAQRLYSNGLRLTSDEEKEFDDYTNNDKLTLVHKGFKEWLRQMSLQPYIETGRNTGVSDAYDTYESEVGFGDE